MAPFSGTGEPDEPERRVVTAQAMYEMSLTTTQALTELKGEQALVRQSVNHVAETLVRMEVSFKEATGEVAQRVSEIKADLKEDLTNQDKRITPLEDKHDALTKKVWGLAGGATAAGALIRSEERRVGQEGEVQRLR